MNHLPNLVTDLALILCCAAVTTLIFKWLKQPVVLGYIIAGLLVGPNFSLFPTITDIEDVKIWAELGVIFLLFSLGLEFSFKKLASLGGTSAVTGIFEISCMLGVGYLVGRMLGWPLMNSIFLGGILAISSTTIIIRAFDELKVKNKKFAGAVLGILIIEDLAAVLLLVILSTLSVKSQVEGSELMMAMLKLLFFLCLWFISGIFILPTLLKAGKKLMNEETMLIVSLGLCFLMVVVATQIGFSAPLGAFIMGSILAETTQAERIEAIVKPVKNLFGAIFFVSVGMLIDLDIIIEHAIPVFVLTLVVILGKFLFVTIGSLFAGQPLKQSLEAGTSMAQIGEFSFIIATLGLTLGVISDYLYPIAVGVSVITTFATPYMMRSAEPIHLFLEKRLPDKWLIYLNRYSTGTQILSAESDWKKLIRAYMYLVVVNSVIIIAIILITTEFLNPFIEKELDNYILSGIITSLITLGAIGPFLWALTIKKIHNSAYTSLWLDTKYNRGPLVILEIIRNMLAVIFLYILLNQLFPPNIALMVAVVVMFIVLIVFSNRLQSFYDRIESRFLKNLNARDVIEGLDEENNISPWDAHLAYFVVFPESDFIGIPLRILEWREKFGINIASIERGKKIIQLPGPINMLFPYDKIAVIGTDEQLKKFRAIIEPIIEEPQNLQKQKDISLHKIIVNSHNELRGKTIRNSKLREDTLGLVVGIERGGTRILNPDSNLEFEWDDVVWIVGDWKKVKKLNKF